MQSARPILTATALATKGGCAGLPIIIKTSPFKIGFRFAVALLLLVPGTVAALWLSAMQGLAPKPIEPVPFIISTVGGFIMLFLTPKMLYAYGTRLTRPDTLTLSKSGLSIDSMGDHREWRWTDITGIRVQPIGKTSRILVIFLKDGTPGYIPFKLFGNREPDSIRLPEIWKTPVYFRASEYLRDLIEPIWMAYKDIGGARTLDGGKPNERAKVSATALPTGQPRPAR